MTLDRVSLRLLGCLMEKEMTTPDLYPLSVNALIAAANQRSSREPVMELEEEQVRSGLDVLVANELVAAAREAGRVSRFEHRIRTVLSLRRDETAILCLLFLRGPQTPGELRGRAERMFSFDDSAQVQSALERLAQREEPLVSALARQPGAREVRWTHRLGAPAAATESTSVLPPPTEDLRQTVDELNSQVRDLQRRMQALETALEESFGGFRSAQG